MTHQQEKAYTERQALGFYNIFMIFLWYQIIKIKIDLNWKPYFINPALRIMVLDENLKDHHIVTIR